MKLRLCIALLLLGQAALTAAAAADRPLRTRAFLLTYRAAVKAIPAGAQRVDLWVPYPKSDRSQTVRQVRLVASSPVILGRSTDSGNQMVHLSARAGDPLPTLRMEVFVVRREYAGHAELLTAVEKDAYLQAEPMVPLDGLILALAREAVAGKKGEAEKARAIYEKVTAMMKYDKSGTGWGRGDALFACDAKRGNCTDFHSLIIGMARSQGIPARFVMGLPLPEKRGKGEIAGYHCWAELYVRRAWVPVDSSEAAKAIAAGMLEKKSYYFGHHDENRLEFSRGRMVVLEPRQKDAPLNFFIYPYLEVDGKQHDAVEWKFEYADLEPPPTHG